ncbi:MAG: hypothetical protein ACYCUG_13750 [Acidimicrobiales bacterium]
MFVPTGLVVPPGARAWTRSILAAGRRREELVVAPGSRRPDGATLALSLVLHGSDATPPSRSGGPAPDSLAAQGRAVLVYPAGVGQSSNAGGGCCGAAVPVLLAGGIADPRTRWGGVLATAAVLRARDGLGGAGRVEWQAGGRVTVTTWHGATPRQVLRLVAYAGRGHGWPQA